jgi:hypothetical protein
LWNADLRIGTNQRLPANLAESEFGAPGASQSESGVALLAGQLHPAVALSYVGNGQFVPISRIGNILN